MTSPNAAITPGSRVRLHLALYLDDGTEVLSSFDAAPLELRIGDGTLAPGLEDLLVGLEAGADEQVLADGATIYGTPDPSLIQWVQREDLPTDFEIVPGQVVNFATPGGQQTPATILAAEERGVQIDFNHPLAHRGLRIRLQVLDVS